MKWDSDYDDVGLDGLENKKAYEKLPVSLRYFIHSQQNLLSDKIKRKVESEHGQVGLKSLVKTSGFRAVSVNKRHGGVVDSLHLFGCAIDFAKIGIFKDMPIPVCCNLECIDSGDCWHVQFKRGS